MCWLYANEITSVKIIRPKMAKNATTIKKLIPALSLEPHVLFFERFDRDMEPPDSLEGGLPAPYILYYFLYPSLYAFPAPNVQYLSFSPNFQ